MSTTIAIEQITKERMLATPYAKYGSTMNSIIIDLLNNQCKHKVERSDVKRCNAERSKVKCLETEKKEDEEVQS